MTSLLGIPIIAYQVNLSTYFAKFSVQNTGSQAWAAGEAVERKRREPRAQEIALREH